MFRVRYGVALAALVVLAGCGSLVTPAGDGTSTRTVTPAPLPRETPAPAPGGPATLAPGLSPEGVFDAARLAEAHATVLSRTSFTAVREERRRHANGSLRSSYRRVVRMSTGGERFVYELNQTDVRGGRADEGRLALYSNGSTVYAATTRNGETAYSVLGGATEPSDPTTVLPENATARSGTARLLGTLRFDVVDRRSVDGRAVYRLTVENGSQDLDRLRNVRMNASVRADGLVTAYRLAYDVDGIRVAVTVDFRDVGETDVAPPAWLPAARNATGAGARPDRRETPGAALALRVPTGADAVSPIPRVPGASGAVSSRSSSAGVRP